MVLGRQVLLSKSVDIGDDEGDVLVLLQGEIHQVCFLLPFLFPACSLQMTLLSTIVACEVVSLCTMPLDMSFLSTGITHILGEVLFLSLLNHESR